VTAVDAVWDGGALRVRSTEDGQRRTEAFLEQLRRGAVPYEFDVRSVSLRDEPDSDAIVGELDRLGGAPLPPTLVERILSADAHGGLRGGGVAAFPGVWARLERVESRAYVIDWDVEIAQSTSIADPIASTFESGLRTMLRVSPTTGDRTLVTIQATSGDVESPVRRVEMRTKDLGSAEMPELRGGYVSTEWLAKAGDTVAVVLAAPVSASAGVRQVLLVRLVSAPPKPELPSISIVPIGAVGSPLESSFLVAPAYEPANEKWRGCLGLAWKEADHRLGSDEIAERVKMADESGFEREGNSVAEHEWPGGGALVVGGEKSFQDRATAMVAAIESETLHPAHLSVRLAARNAAGTSERTLGVVAAPALTGRNVALAAYASIPFIGDYDVEVAEAARIADPMVNVAVGGAVLNIRLSQGPAGGWRADLDLVAASAGPVESMPVTASEIGVIERVAVKRARASQAVVLEDGKAKEIDLGANPWGAGRLVAIVRVQR
jgi:hypothetical protein